MSNERLGSYNGGEQLSGPEFGPEWQSGDFEAPEEKERFRVGAREASFEMANLEESAEELGVMPPEIVSEEVQKVEAEGEGRLVDRAEKSAIEKEASDAVEDMQLLRRQNLAIYGYHGGDDYGGQE